MGKISSGSLTVVDVKGGSDGINTATIYLYQRAATVPSKPSTNLTYTFATAKLTGGLGNWTQDIGTLTGSDPIWVIAAVASSNGKTDVIEPTEWSEPIKMAQDGQDGQPGAPGQPGAKGLNQATVFIYKRDDSVEKPNSVTYTFATGSFAVPTGWSTSIPQSNGKPCWVCSAVAIGSDDTAQLSWTNPSVMVEDGSDGVSPVVTSTDNGVQIYDPVNDVTYTITNGVDGTSYYTHILYSSKATPTSASDVSTSPTGKDYVGIQTTTSRTAPSWNDSGWQWMKYVGEDGTPATQYYAFVKYATNSSGANMRDTPADGYDYVGTYTGTKSNPAASDFNWSKYTGEPGQPATQYYAFIKYATSSTGANMTDTPTASTKYVGTYSGTKASPAASDYKWSVYVGTDGVSVTKTRELYYLKTNSTNVPTITATSQITATDRVNGWTSIVPTYVANGTYYTCIETSLSVGGPVWSTPVENQGLTDANANAAESLSVSTHANENAQGALSISRATQQHFWFVPENIGSGASLIEAGAYITDTAIDTFKSGKNGGYLLARSDGVELGRGTNKFMTLSATALNFYRPGTNTIDATLTSNGLILTKGGLKVGTYNASAADANQNFVYLSSEDYGTGVKIGDSSSDKKDWRQLIGNKFGVDRAGNLYASGANITGKVTITSGSNVYTKDEVDDAVGDATAELISAKEASGSIVHVEDASEYPALDCKVFLDPIQDLNGYDSPWVGGAGKNKLPMTLASLKAVNTGATWSGNTYTKNGITFTVLTDANDNIMGIRANGTATAETTFYQIFNTKLPLASGQYIFNGCPSGGGDTTYRMQIRIESTWYGETGSGRTFTYDASATGTDLVRIDILNGAVCNNVVFLPMIRLASVSDASYEPYSNICPISGRTSVETTRTGKNLLAPYATSQTKNGITFTVNSDGTIKANGTATVTTVLYLSAYEDLWSSGSYILNGCPSGGGNNKYCLRLYTTGGTTFVSDFGSGVTFTGQSQLECAIVIWNGQTVSNVVFKPMIRLASDTDDTYEPYQGTTYTTALGRTVYGGTLDVVSGVLTVDRASITLDGDVFSLSYNGQYTTGNTEVRFTPNPVKANGATNLIADRFRIVNYTSAQAEVGMARGNPTRDFIYFCVPPTVTSKAEAIAYFQANPTQVVYELATPQTYQLTPQQVELFQGVNNVWADFGDTYLKYVTMNSDMLSLMDKSNADLSRAKSEIDSKKSVHTLNTNYSYTYANILTYSAEGYGGTAGANWVVSSTEGVKPGDTVRLKVTVSDMNNTPVYIIGTVVSITSTTALKAISHGLDTTIIDGGNILTNSIGANQIKANSLTIGKIATDDQDKILNSNIEVGGRNYIRDSEVFDGWSCAPDSEGTAEINDGVLHIITKGGYARANGWFSIKYSELISKPTTFSVDVKANSTLAKNNIVVQLFQTDKPYRSVSSGNITEGKRVILGTNYATGLDDVNENTWTRVSWTIPDVKALIDAYNSSVYEYFALYLGARNNADGEVYFRKPKFEYGTKATDWSPAPEDAGNTIEIGGRNLARGTAEMIKGSGSWSTGTWRDSGSSNTYNYTVSDSPVASVSKGVLVTTKVANTRYGVCQDNCPMLSKKVTFSVWAKGTAGGTIALQSIWWSNIPSSTHNAKIVTATGEWQYITFTADLTNATVPNDKCSISYLYWQGVNVNDTCVFIAPKLEYGNKATDWTPAPEDVQAEIDAKKSVHTLDTSYSYTYANILTYSAEGYSGTWTSNGALANGVKIGDTVRLKVTVSDMSNAPVYVVGTVTAVTTNAVTMTSHGLDTTIIDGGNILTNSIGANQIKTNAITADKIAADAITIGDMNQDAKDKVLNSNINVGGRNLLGGTANAVVPVLSTGDANNSFGSVARYNSPASEFSLEDYDETSKSMVITSSVTGNRGVGWYTYQGDVVAGETYTFSCRVKSSVAATVHTHTAWRNGSATAGYTGWTSGGSVSLMENVWTDYSYTFTPSSSAKLDWEFMVALCFTGQTTGVTCRIAHAKFEKGNKVTDWSPAPAELAATATSYITKINEEGITIHPEDPTSRNYLQINSDGISINTIKGTIAQYGESIRLGDSSTYLEITSNIVEFFDNKKSMAKFGYDEIFESYGVQGENIFIKGAGNALRLDNNVNGTYQGQYILETRANGHLSLKPGLRRTEEEV